MMKTMLKRYFKERQQKKVSREKDKDMELVSKTNWKKKLKRRK